MKLLQKHFSAALIATIALTGGILKADTPDATVPMEKQANLTASQMTGQTANLMSQMDAALRRILQLQAAARKNNQIMKLNCINDKLLQVKKLMNIAETSRTSLIAAESDADPSARYHYFGQLTIAQEKVSGLRDEAEACIGDNDVSFVGDNELKVVKPNISDDPTGGLDLFPDFERPGYASPFN